MKRPEHADTAAEAQDVANVNAAPIWTIVRGFSAYWILMAAIELGVFAMLADGPLSGDALAARCGGIPRRLAAIVDVLVDLGLLNKDAGVYRLTPVSAKFLVPGRPAYMGQLIASAPGHPENWPGLAASIRSGRPFAPIEADPEAFYADLADATFAVQYAAARELIGSERFVLRRPPIRILELGAGAAPWSAALLEASPDALATVNDLPAVLEHAKAMLRERGLADRCRFLPGSFHAIAIDEEAYDLAILGHVCRGESEAGARALIDRVYRALRAEGRLILVDYFTDDERTSAMQALMLDAIMIANTANGACFSYSQVEAWLSSAGFVQSELIRGNPLAEAFIARKGG